MSRIMRALLGAAVATAATVGLLPALGGVATAAPVGYPTVAATGFHHLGLVYDNPQRTADDWTSWVAEYSGGRPVKGGWMFDSFVTLDLNAPSGNATDTGATTAADWTALLNRWFGTAPGGGTIGAIDAAVTRVAGSVSTTGALMGQPPTRRKVLVTMPWAANWQASFGVVDGRAADLRVASERDRVSTWFVDQVRQRFVAAGYRNLDLWGIYMMREDILPADEGWMTRTAATVHQRGLKIAWIPYYLAPGWDRWRSFGLDVAIMQPSYGFRSPTDGGSVDAGRLAATADLAKNAGLGVEIEARSAAGSPYEAAMFQQYLSEGERLGYRDAATAYFLGWARKPVSRDDAYLALADYLSGISVRSADVLPAWQWTGTGVRTANATFAARNDLTATRVELAAGTTWRGTMTVEQRVGTTWQAGGTTYAGAAQAAGSRQTVLVPLATAIGVNAVRVVFTPAAGVAAVVTPRIVLDTVWPIGSAALSTGAPYTVSANQPPAPIYGDTAGTATGYGRGLLTDGQWSTSGWWNARPIGWWDSAPVRVIFNLGSARLVDRVELRTHNSPDAAVNWPMDPALRLSPVCQVLAPSVRGAVDGCAVTTLTGSAPVITGVNGASVDGTIVFAPPAPVSTRYATLMMQSTGWLLADEVRFFSGGQDITAAVTYRLVTPPNSQSVDPGLYGDNGSRLTDGNAAPIMSGPAVNGWRAPAGYSVTVDLMRTTPVRTATAWFIDQPSWGVAAPAVLTVSTSTDGVSWSVLSQTTTASRAWNSAVSYAVTGAVRPARYVRFSVPANANLPTSWHMLSEVGVTA